MILIYIRGLLWLLFVKILWCKQGQGYGQGTRDILSYDLMFSSFFRMDLALKLHLGNMSTEQILTKLGIVWRFTCVMQMSLGILFAGKTCVTLCGCGHKIIIHIFIKVHLQEMFLPWTECQEHNNKNIIILYSMWNNCKKHK